MVKCCQNLRSRFHHDLKHRGKKGDKGGGGGSDTFCCNIESGWMRFNKAEAVDTTTFIPARELYTHTHTQYSDAHARMCKTACKL